MDYAGILGGTASVFLRSTATGVTTLQEITENLWLDKLGGNDWTKSHIFRVSFQSLRVGAVNFSMVDEGHIVKVARIQNDNIRNIGYWQYANLPQYWKVYNDGANTVTEFGYGDELNGVGFRYTFSGLKAGAQALGICSTIKSQGGGNLFDLPAVPFVTPILAAKTVSTTLIPLLSIRVSATFNSIVNRAIVIPTSYSVVTDQPIDYALIYRPTLTGASFAAIDATYNGVDYDNTASAITGGYRVDGDYITGSNSSPQAVRGLLGRIIMSVGSSGTSDILTIAAIRAGANNASVKTYIKGKDLR
jgi:hypothetical protein